MRPSWALVALLLATTTQPINAQTSSGPERSIGLGVSLGVVGWAVGGLGAAALATGCGSDDDSCHLTAFFIGAAIGGTFGMALGVHVGNDRRGRLALDFLSGALVWGAGIGLAAASGWENTASAIIVVTVPVAQLVTTVLVERATGRARTTDQTVGVLILPQRDGRVGLGASVRF